MKILALLLIAANLILLGMQLGPFQTAVPPPRPAEVAPQNLRLLQAERPIPTRCVEFGGFADADKTRVENLLAELKLDTVAVPRQARDASTWMVYVPPARSRADAERTQASLRSQGIRDLYLILDDSTQRLGISLGLFSSEAAASTQRQALERRGISGLRIARRAVPAERTWYQVRAATGATLAGIDALLRQFPDQEKRDCP